MPPAASTRPSSSGVSEKSARVTLMLAVTVQELVAGSNNSVVQVVLSAP